MFDYLVVFSVAFIYIFLKATQQLNVVNYEYLRVPVISMFMALCEVTITLSVVHKVGFWGFIPLGLGGALGAMLGMYLHQNRKKGR